MGRILTIFNLRGHHLIVAFLLSFALVLQAGCGLEYVIDPKRNERGWKAMGEDLAWKDAKARELCREYIGITAERVQDEWGPPNPDDVSKTIRSYRKNEVWLRGEIGGQWEPIPVDESWTYTRLRSREPKQHTHEYNVTFFFKDGVVVWADTQ